MNSINKDATKKIKLYMTRSERIKYIIENTLSDNVYSYLFEFKRNLQEDLNSKLDFETSVIDIEEKNSFIFGKVFFKNENDLNTVIDFTITNETV